MELLNSVVSWGNVGYLIVVTVTSSVLVVIFSVVEVDFSEEDIIWIVVEDIIGGSVEGGKSVSVLAPYVSLPISDSVDNMVSESGEFDAAEI